VPCTHRDLLPANFGMGNATYAARCYAVAVVVYYFVSVFVNLGSGSPRIRLVLPPNALNTALLTQPA
jgi:hypothetical protein